MQDLSIHAGNCVHAILLRAYGWEYRIFIPFHFKQKDSFLTLIKNNGTSVLNILSTDMIHKKWMIAYFLFFYLTVRTGNCTY